MSKPEKYYSEEPMARTLKDIRKCANNQSSSCAHQPLLNVPLENIILDELHLMLRITGKVSVLRDDGNYIKAIICKLVIYTLQYTIDGLLYITPLPVHRCIDQEPCDRSDKLG